MTVTNEPHMPCPLGCGETIARSEVREHFEEGCPDD